MQHANRNVAFEKLIALIAAQGEKTMNITIDRKVIEQALDALNHGIAEMNNRGCAVECMPLHRATRALREALAQPQPVQQEPVMYQFRWTNPAGQQVNDTEIGWTRVEPRLNGTVQEKCAEILAHRYGEKPCYEVRALYTSQQAAQPLTKTQRAEQAHGITKGTT